MAQAQGVQEVKEKQGWELRLRREQEVKERLQEAAVLEQQRLKAELVSVVVEKEQLLLKKQAEKNVLLKTRE